VINTNILWSRAIEPVSGKIQKKPTVLGCALILAGAFVAAYLIYVLFSVL